MKQGCFPMISSFRHIRRHPLPTLLALLALLVGTLDPPATHAFAATISTITQISDINLKGADSDPANLTDVNGTMFFAAYTAGTGVELWKSDGVGTVLVKDIRAGILGSN